jgi:hypothetical protein
MSAVLAIGITAVAGAAKPRTTNVFGEIETDDGIHPSALREAVIDIDRDVKINAKGLPSCKAGQLEATKYQRGQEGLRQGDPRQRQREPFGLALFCRHETFSLLCNFPAKFSASFQPRALQNSSYSSCNLPGLFSRPVIKAKCHTSHESRIPSCRTA